ncbi:hypothetical protein HMPREF9550_02971 [Escherichia coli MS 187-1]|nr:hypothetical protein HMPREF9550_02971 [Escherichia coli MS 187-1]
MPSRAIKDFAYIVIFLSRQTTRRQQPSRYGQRGQGVNGGSVKIWTGVWVKQAGCCYSTVVVTQWNTDVKNSQWASGYIVAARQQLILLVCRVLARQSCSTPAIVPLTTETALLSCIKQAREDVLTLRHLQLLHQNR